MSAPAALRVGWCPGALRPMMSGDGLIVRVKPRGMALSVEAAMGIAAAAVRHGNGSIDLTARANLQIRGVTEAGLPALTAELDALGLLDADAGAETRRNVMASPLMGLDAAAAFDVRPAVTTLEVALTGASDLDALPSKFGFAVSDGGAMALDDVSADVRFDARPDGRFAVRLDGNETAIGSCAMGDMPGVAIGLARAFTAASARNPRLRRMRDVAAATGNVAILGRTGLDGLGPASAPPPPFPRGGGDAVGWVRFFSPRGRGIVCSTVEGATEPPRFPSLAPRHVGPIDLVGMLVLGAAAAFGRLDAARLDALARGAAHAGAVELRMTPWRALLIPGLAPTALDRLAAHCAAAGLIVDPEDPRLRVAACAGGPECRRGTTPVLDDAAAFALLVPPGDGIVLHVSGCAKGCAHPGPAPLTLVASGGRYGLVADGTPSDAPVACDLGAAEARRLLKTLLRPDSRP